MKTKIIATVGPSCSTKEKLDLLIKSGVTCFRVNLSHGTKNEKIKYFDLIKSCRLESGIRPTVLADLAGPKIRVSRVKDSIKIQKGEQVYISSEKNGKNVIPISEGVKFQTVKKGAKILVDDGKISLEENYYIDVLEYRLKDNIQSFNHPFHLIPLNQFDNFILDYVEMCSGKGYLPLKTKKDFENMET